MKLAVFLLAMPLLAQQSFDNRALIGSQVVLVGSLAADGAESWNAYEATPLLRAPDGRFSPQRAIPIWAASATAIILIEHWINKKPLPKWANWAIIGGNGFIAGEHFHAAFAGRH